MRTHIVRQISRHIAERIMCWIRVEDLKKILTILLKNLSSRSDFYFTYRERPKRAAGISFDPMGNTYQDYAIVLQGPVVTDDDFTLETIRIYQKNFPQVTVIVSTWESVCSTFEIAIGEMDNAVLLKNKMPMPPGIQNVNLQIFSTVQALLKAKEFGKKFTVKTRCDQRVYNPLFLKATLLLSMIPPKAGCSDLRSRLIVSSFGSIKFRPYGISDMLMLGHTEDMLKYWDIDMDRRVVTNIDNHRNCTVREYALLRLAETYILSSFLAKQGITTDFTLRHTWEIYNRLFIVLDKDSFNMFWNKYSIEREDRLTFYSEHVYREMTFFEWLALFEQTSVPEQVLEADIVGHSM